MKKKEIEIALENLDTRLFLILKYLEVIVTQTTKLEENLVERLNSPVELSKAGESIQQTMDDIKKRDLKQLEEDYKQATEETGL